MAKAYRFKLDFLIKLRQHKEEEAMARLAKRLASIKNLENEIEEQLTTKTRLNNELDQKIKSGEITIPLLTLYKEYNLQQERNLTRLNEFLGLSHKEEAKERAILTQASISLKIMEKLKEKKRNVFIAEQIYIEQNNLEEMAALAKATQDRENRI